MSVDTETEMSPGNDAESHRERVLSGLRGKGRAAVLLVIVVLALGFGAGTAYGTVDWINSPVTAYSGSYLGTSGYGPRGYITVTTQSGPNFCFQLYYEHVDGSWHAPPLLCGGPPTVTWNVFDGYAKAFCGYVGAGIEEIDIDQCEAG